VLVLRVLQVLTVLQVPTEIVPRTRWPDQSPHLQHL